MTDMMEWAVGIDIGGTNTKTGLLDRQGTLRHCRSFPTPRSGGMLDMEMLAQKAVEPWRNTPKWNDVKGIGVGIPGILNEQRTLVKYAVNLGLKDAPLVEWLQSTWGKPVKLDSDVIVGAIGERYHGAASGFERFMYISIGTGIGACLYENGVIYRNSFGGPMNIGHMSVYPDGMACSCGNQGCLERYVSASGLMERYAEASSNEKVSVETICRRADEGEAEAFRAITAAGRALGTAIVNLVQIFGVCPIVIGGGLSQISALIAGAEREFQRRGGSLLDFQPMLCTAASSSYAGVIGAASIVLKN